MLSQCNRLPCNLHQSWNWGKTLVSWSHSFTYLSDYVWREQLVTLYPLMALQIYILLVFPNHLDPCLPGVIRFSCLKIACNLKLAGHRAKQSEIWDACNSKVAVCRGKRIEIWNSAVVIISIWDTFDLLVFNATWDPSVHFLKIATNTKTASLG